MWSPNPNAVLWNGGREGVVGTAFGPIDGANITNSTRLASVIADANPGTAVYLVNVVFGGTPICHWIGTCGAPDAYASIVNEVTNALTVSGATQVDLFQWDQGESDAGTPSTTYMTSFETLITTLKSNAWFRPTNTMIYGIAASSTSGLASYDAMNVTLQSLANADPSRIFVPTGILPPTTSTFAGYWQTAAIHMTGLGYFTAGSLAAALLYDQSTAEIPFVPLVSCGSGMLSSVTPSGQFRLIAGKTVIANMAISGVVVGSGAGYMKVSIPFQAAPFQTGVSRIAAPAYDIGTGKTYTAALASADANYAHVFSSSGGFPDGESAPAITAIYQRQ
jgi:hypothetical protein